MTHGYIVEFGDGETLTVFAESTNQAATIFITYRELHGHTMPESFSIGRALKEIRNPRQREHMRSALRRCEIGVGRYDPSQGYDVVPVLDADQEGSGAPWDR